MTLYLSLTSLPDLTDFPEPVRRLVVRRARALMRRDTKLPDWLPTIFAASGGVVGSLLEFLTAAYLFPHKPLPEQINLQVVLNPASACAGGLVGGFIGLQLQICKLRPYLRRALEDHASQPSTTN
jgi:hypothetical protein